MFLAIYLFILLATNFVFATEEDSPEITGSSSAEELIIDDQIGTKPPTKLTSSKPDRMEEFIPKSAKIFRPGKPVTIIGKEIIEEDRFFEEDIMDRIVQTDRLLEALPVTPPVYSNSYKPGEFATQIQTGIVYTFKHVASGRTMVLDHKPNKNGWRYITFRHDEDIKEESTKYFMVMPTSLFKKAFGETNNYLNNREYFLVGLLQKQGWGGTDYIFPITGDFSTKQKSRLNLGSNVAVAFNPLRCRKGADSDKATGCFESWSPLLFQFIKGEGARVGLVSLYERYPLKEVVMYYGPATAGDKRFPNAFVQNIKELKEFKIDPSATRFMVHPAPSLTYNVKEIKYDINRDLLDKSAKNVILYSERTLQNRANTTLVSAIKYKKSMTESYTFKIDTGIETGASIKYKTTFAEIFGAGVTGTAKLEETSGNSWTESSETEISVSHSIILKPRTSVKVEGILRMVEKFNIPFNSTIHVTMKGLRFDMKRHKVVEANVPTEFLKKWIDELWGKPKWTYVRDVTHNIVEANVQGNVFIDAGIKSYLKLTPIKE